MPACPPPPVRPSRLLTQNRRLRAIGVWNWTLPAWAGRLPDGRTYNTCPSAGVCRHVCYARHGAYRWPAVKARHEANLAFVLEDLLGWEQAMLAELAHPRFTGTWVRIHDAGDFFSDDYLCAWLRVCRARPETHFYCYTKEVTRFRRIVEPDPPPNFRWTYSYGGTQDALLDPNTDRVADVFPDEAAIAAAGFSSQSERDTDAVLGLSRTGIPANHIPHFQAKQGRRRFSEWQAATERERRAA
ncbi:hypothetical protein [Kutzneria buriramensis]|uniref:Gene product 88 domain-containing protein n=1 Tax=Kutzneria buriramensis TaxID=1045776 RepID=A0A3E0GVL6_9PSEU|nr:hypothetical protein [Kutzneria buriramensis]REH28659.1 hypothetical protein BCF44_126101 [Kutzneria buriramensis]